MKISDLDQNTKEDLENNISKDDIVDKMKISDTRKPRLTLKHLQKLRKMRELNKLEMMYQGEQLELVFGGSDDELSQ